MARTEAGAQELGGGRRVVHSKDGGWGSVGCNCVVVDVIGCDQKVIFGDHDMRGEMMAHRQHCAFQRT